MSASSSTPLSVHAKREAAFYGIIDLLGILPYYIEIALQQDTVSGSPIAPSSTLTFTPLVHTIQVYNPAYF